VIVTVSSLSSTIPVFDDSCCYCSSFIDVLEDFHAVDVVELLMIDDHNYVDD